jgi:hypothetical protein
VGQTSYEIEFFCGNPLYLRRLALRSRSANSSVNLSPVADRKDPNEPGLAIDFMDDRAYRLLEPVKGLR